VVRRSERPLAHRDAGRGKARDRVDAGDLEGVLGLERVGAENSIAVLSRGALPEGRSRRDDVEGGVVTRIPLTMARSAPRAIRVRETR
jgi:hypothetical protein